MHPSGLRMEKSASNSSTRISVCGWGSTAEPAKSEGKGFDGEQLRAELEEIGFTTEIRHEWYLGQAVVMHGDSIEAAESIDAHLRRLLPISEPLFKYLVVTATKR